MLGMSANCQHPCAVLYKTAIKCVFKQLVTARICYHCKSVVPRLRYTQLAHSVMLLSLAVKKLNSIVNFRVGAHSLPMEQARIGMPHVSRHLRRCTFCTTVPTVIQVGFYLAVETQRELNND